MGRRSISPRGASMNRHEMNGRADRIGHRFPGFGEEGGVAISSACRLRHSTERQHRSMKMVFTAIGKSLLLLMVLCPCGFAGTFTAFGPKPYTRTNGRPVVIGDSFSILNPDTQYVIRVESRLVDEDNDSDSDDHDPRGRAQRTSNDANGYT